MISGWVNNYSEAVVRLPLRGLQGREQTVEAVIDTGFNGYLTLPPSLISALGLPFRRNGRAVLGDGSEITFDIHEAVVLWNGQPRRIAVDAADMPPAVKLVYGKQRLLHFAKLAVDVPDGLFLMTTRSGHYIHSSEPELVIWAIRRALKK